MIIRFFEIFWNSFVWFLAFFTIIIFTFFAFSFGGWLTGIEREKLEAIIALGDPRTIFPLSFIYLLGLGLMFVFRSSPKIRKYATWISSFGVEGLFAFAALLLSLAVAATPSNSAGLFASMTIVLGVIGVRAILETIYEQTQDRILNLILGWGLISSAVCLPGVPSGL
jgi:hypothetical protein